MLLMCHWPPKATLHEAENVPACRDAFGAIQSPPCMVDVENKFDFTCLIVLTEGNLIDKVKL